MAIQTQFESTIDDPKWASGTIVSQNSDVAVRLKKRPGVVGGQFKAQLVGLLPEHAGRAEVTLSSTGFESESRRCEIGTTSPDISFLEVGSFQIQSESVEIHFLIPYEAKGTDEGFEWILQIQFANGTIEVFEVPICRTHESNPEVTELEIAAAGLNAKEQWYAQQPEERSGRSWRKPYELAKTDQELHVTIPSRISGRPSLAKGLGVFWGLWASATALFYWISGGELEPMVILGIPLLAMSGLLVFLLFGISKNRLCERQLETRHTLLGFSIPKRIKRTEIEGFLKLCVGSLGDPGGSYLVVARRKDSGNTFLSAALLNKSDAQNMVKRLNTFWGICQHQ